MVMMQSGEVLNSYEMSLLPRHLRAQEEALVDPNAPAAPDVVPPPDEGDDTPLPAAADTQTDDDDAIVGDPSLDPDDSQPPQGDTVSRADYETLNQAHRTLQGKYSAEVPRLQQQVRELTEENERLKTAPTIPVPPAGQKWTREDLQKAGISEDFLDEHGDDFAVEVASLIDAVAESRVRGVKAEVAQTRKERYLTQLGEKEPDWPALQNDNDWWSWLGEPDPMTGRIRSDLLKEAQNDFDAPRVAAIIERYRGTQGAPPAAPPAPPSKAAERNRQIMPTPSTTPTSPRNQKTYTEAQYKSQMKDIARSKAGQGPYSLAQAAKLEKQLDEAVEQGRIVA